MRKALSVIALAILAVSCSRLGAVPQSPGSETIENTDRRAPATVPTNQYAIVDLGATFTPARLNRKGMVVGAQGAHAAYYKNGSVTLFPNLPGELGSGANDVNNHGQAVGYVVLGSTYGTFAARFREKGKPIVLASPAPNFGGAVANGINDDGKIVGEFIGGCAQAVVFDGNGLVTKLQSPSGPGDVTFSATAVNAKGAIAAFDFEISEGPCAHGKQLPEVFDPFASIPLPPDSMTGIGTLHGGAPTDINNAGSVVGSYFQCNSAITFCGTAGFYYHHGQTTPIYNVDPNVAGTCLGANAINNKEQIVGFDAGESYGDCGGPSQVSRAILIVKGKIVDLNTYLRAHSGWVLNSGADINEPGIIVGQGTYHGVTHGFMLVPASCSLPKTDRRDLST